MGWGQESSLCVTDKCLSLDCQAATQLGKCAEEAIRGQLGSVTAASPSF